MTSSGPIKSRLPWMRPRATALLLAASVLLSLRMVSVSILATHGSETVPQETVEEHSDQRTTVTVLDPDRPVRMLLGIFTHNKTAEERSRRKALRETYLQHRNKDGYPSFCPLRAVIGGRLNIQNCRVLYTFVFGGFGFYDERGAQLPPKEKIRVNISAEILVNEELVADDVRTWYQSQEDAVALNITENSQEEGKTPTWFRYGTLVLKELGWWDGRGTNGSTVDFVARVDSDTIIFPTNFFQWVMDMQKEGKLLPYPLNTRVYGTVVLDKKAAGFPFHDHSHLITAPLFVSGEFILLSTDLANYVTSPDVFSSHANASLPHEDLQMANHVFTYPEYLRQSACSNHSCGNKSKSDEEFGIRIVQSRHRYTRVWMHPIKSPSRIRNLYRQMEEVRN